jgi:folate-binding protein YgfZ
LLAGIGVAALPPGAYAFDASEVRGAGRALHVPADGAAAVWDALVAAGAEPCGMRAVEARRVEVGVPRIGVDMDSSTLALEVPVEDMISATKGCYLGQEVIARGTARGQVQRRLVGVRFDGGAPARGTSLRHASKEVGRVTSIARAQGDGEPIGLALVRREHWGAGSELETDAGRARVAAFPIA